MTCLTQDYKTLSFDALRYCNALEQITRGLAQPSCQIILIRALLKGSVLTYFTVFFYSHTTASKEEEMRKLDIVVSE
jgi:hypothetical protein